jgi:protein involved in temperature-dependent protein secretion
MAPASAAPGVALLNWVALFSSYRLLSVKAPRALFDLVFLGLIITVRSASVQEFIIPTNLL